MIKLVSSVLNEELGCQFKVSSCLGECLHPSISSAVLTVGRRWLPTQLLWRILIHLELKHWKMSMNTFHGAIYLPSKCLLYVLAAANGQKFRSRKWPLRTALFKAMWFRNVGTFDAPKEKGLLHWWNQCEKSCLCDASSCASLWFLFLFFLNLLG